LRVESKIELNMKLIDNVESARRRNTMNTAK
jgi:hypothetical protein